MSAYQSESRQESKQSTSADSYQSLSVAQERSKPQCWDHGCNGRKFTTFSNLLRHQREASGVSSKSTCPRCGAEFTRATARNAHVTEGKCTQKTIKKVREDQPEHLGESDVSVIKRKHAVEDLKQKTEKNDVLMKPHHSKRRHLVDDSESSEEEVGINERQAKAEGPFAGLKRLLVVAGGIVVDQDGNTVAHVVEGDPQRLVGYAVDEDGDIVDKYGNVKGHVKPVEEEQIKTQISALPIENKYVAAEGMKKLQILDLEGLKEKDDYEPDTVEEGATIDLEKKEEEMEVVEAEEKDVEGKSGHSSSSWKCSDSSCKYHNYGWPAERQRDLHMKDNHPSPLPVFEELLGYQNISHSVNTTVTAPEESVPLSAIDIPMGDRGIVTSERKRKRNATASHRFRQRRKDVERENANYITKLERQIREMTQERDFYGMEEDLQRDEPEGAVDDVSYHVADPLPDLSEEADILECIDCVEEEEADSQAGAEESDEGKAERIIQDLLGRYTTLYDQ